MTEKQLALAQKLYAMSKDTEHFEAQNATKMLAALMEKLGISLDDIEGNSTQERQFYLKTDQEEAILFGIVFKVINEPEINYKVNKDKRRKRYLKLSLTDAQYIEIKAMLDFYLPIYAAELKDFTTAFVLSQKLYSNRQTDEEEPKERKPQSAEERQRSQKIAHTAMGIPRKNYFKPIE